MGSFVFSTSHDCNCCEYEKACPFEKRINGTPCSVIVNCKTFPCLPKISVHVVAKTAEHLEIFQMRNNPQSVIIPTMWPLGLYIMKTQKTHETLFENGEVIVRILTKAHCMAAVVRVMTGISGLPVNKSSKRIVPSRLQSITLFTQKLKLTMGEPV